MAIVTGFCFGISGGKGLFKLFCDLENIVINPLDDEEINKDVPLADKKKWIRFSISIVIFRDDIVKLELHKKYEVAWGKAIY